MVSVVGWDDDYSRDNFSTDESKWPNNNGAWLCKNSYGKGAGEEGFFWLSYEQVIGSAAVYVAADGQVKEPYGHDNVAAKDSIPHNWSAVIFMAEDDEEFTEVSFHTRNDKVHYELYLNNLGSGVVPATPGSLRNAVASGTIDMAGYHTVTLDEPFKVKMGENFSVILKLDDKSEYAYVSAVEDTGFVTSSHETTRAGKSYFADVKTGLPLSDDWVDGKQIRERLLGQETSRDTSCGACIKIFSVSGGTNPNTPDNPDNPVNPDDPKTESSSGGGGCEAMAFPVILAVMLAACRALKRK